MSKIIFGIDLGGTRIKIGLFDINGNLISKGDIPTDTSNNGQNIIDDIARELLRSLEERQAGLADIVGIGIDVPGAVLGHTTVNRCVNLGWGLVDVSSKLSEAMGIPRDWVIVGNDANVAALGEFFDGGAKEYSSMMMVTIGTGVGGGLIMDGNIIDGVNGAAAEIGHIPVSDDLDFDCSCGNRGCLEQLASATAIARMAGTADAKEAFDRAYAGDELAVKAIDTAAEALGKAMAAVACVVDPECFLIGGGVAAAGEKFIEKIRASYAKRAFHSSKKTKILRAKLGNDAGIYGCARMILNRYE